MKCNGLLVIRGALVGAQMGSGWDPRCALVQILDPERATVRSLKEADICMSLKFVEVCRAAF